MFADLSREEEEKAMAALLELVDKRERVVDDGGLDAATLAWINELGGVVAT